MLVHRDMVFLDVEDPEVAPAFGVTGSGLGRG
jgi:hypothetical protein